MTNDTDAKADQHAHTSAQREGIANGELAYAPDGSLVPTDAPRYLALTAKGIAAVADIYKRRLDEAVGLLRTAAVALDDVGMPRSYTSRLEGKIVAFLAEEDRFSGGKPAERAVETPKTGETMGLWRGKVPGGKYLVLRRDNTVPSWPYFVLGARDPNAPAALRQYADMAAINGAHPDYIRDIRAMADEFDEYRKAQGAGDPDAVPHRKDDPGVVARMVNEGKGA